MRYFSLLLSGNDRFGPKAARVCFGVQIWV
jgi:hypothetical protein